MGRGRGHQRSGGDSKLDRALCNFYSHETQRQMLEIRAGAQVFEQLADEAGRYHFLTFQDGTDREHRAALSAQVEVCYERAAGKASEIASQVAALLQNREVRAG